ncbi:hypothetical protein N7493_006753 [Penicillium malachiteum]|uniref:Carboxypeptidase n=1 Tax=Penicillium malachiteum TaxID=1324776 RepID=A0AAD6MUV3_9EURO|nr:hypothetical protein N7493_006753 [Penicillium malachiteum]
MKVSHFVLLGSFAFPTLLEARGHENHHSGDGYTLRTSQIDQSICNNTEGINGYIDLEEDDVHMYFMVQNSRGNSETDPLILWLTGGPGSSGVFWGAFQELGSCVFEDPASTRFNPYSWNANATVIYVEPHEAQSSDKFFIYSQPVNVGYSYSSSPVSTLDKSTSHLLAFTKALFDAFPSWKYRDFYIAGESYGGSYVPALASRIQSRRSSALSKLAASTSTYDRLKINLKGVLIGNGLMNVVVQRRGLYNTGCVCPEPLLSPEACATVMDGSTRCELLEAACQESNQMSSVCAVSNSFCSKNGFLQFNSSERDPYYFPRKCALAEHGCGDNPNLIDWMNSTLVRERLHVDKDVQFLPSSEKVEQDFQKSGEVGYPSDFYVTELLDQGIKVLIYVGNKDWLCHAPGMRMLVDSLIWQGQAKFRALDYQKLSMPISPRVSRLESFHFPAQESLGINEDATFGFHKRYAHLSFFEIEGAGHMAPADEPEKSLLMLHMWMNGLL